MKLRNPIARRDNIVVQELDDEVLIYDLSAGKAFCLNEVSALIWGLCDGERSVAKIGDELSGKLKTTASEDVVWLALEQLKNERLIDNEIQAPLAFASMSRREVIKKIAITSAVALPIVSSIVAPDAAQAASGCPAPGAGSVGNNAPCADVCQCPITMTFIYVCCMVTSNMNPNICWAGGAGSCVT